MIEPTIGHNKPDMTLTAAETTQEISAWMQGVPAIQSEADARLAKVFIDRGALCIKDLEDERTQKTRPLNDQIKKVNDHYRGPRELLQRIIDEVKHRLGRYLQAEERKRAAAAAEARRIAEEAERSAREAERLEQDALSEADSGVLGVDVATVTATADTAFDDYEKADRQAAFAEKETQVRIGGGLRRSAALRNREILTVTDATAAISAIGLTERISQAILLDAKSYRAIKGKLPPGISIKIEREL